MLQALEIYFILIIPIILAFPTLLLIIHFGKQAITQRKKIFHYLTALFIVYFAVHFFEGAQLFAPTPLGAQISFILSKIFRMLMLYILVIIFEFYSQNVLFSGKQTFMAIIVFFTIGGMLSTPNLEVELVDASYIISFEHLSPVIFSQMIFNVSASVWIIIMLRRNYQSATTEEQKKVLKYLFIGMLLAIFIPLLPSLSQSIRGFDPGERNIFFVFITGSLMQNIGILIIGYIFYRISNNPWLLQQQKVYLLIVYSHDGVELYSKAFSKEITHDSLMLLAGGFSAISSMFKEITDAEGIIKAILLEDKELRIIKKEHFISALLVDYSTEATEEAHKSFADEFDKKFKQELTRFAGEVTIFQSADEIIENYFLNY